ncbi:hypothetical protein OG946_13105 [Streptomyces sp. NBC_01808]|uniref:HAD family hydrolase n=1 Tax=Streptomyces sp. NBC_01808 TaxID=2975947 RepID=UPI002DDA4380|nr:HAD family hydrolase [Streptomyces sp. NBC_01808]WSA38225.1 hypothetical protein OG946_13105 [Streptomyces sp. NBC_01808]
MPPPPPAATVLFDLGNVLFCDPWETLLLTPGTGLADRRGLDRERVRAEGTELWARYSLSATAEESYWAELSAALRIPLTREFVRSLEEELLLPHPEADRILAAAAASGRRIGIVSNNTTFWYAKQAAALDLLRFVDPALVFLSCTEGVSKGTRPGLLELAADRTDPARTLVVEDRPAHLRRAAGLGFETLEFSLAASVRDPSNQLLEKLSDASGPRR